MRLSGVWSWLWLVVPALATVAHAESPSTDHQAVRLPGIVHKWRLPGSDENLPDITIEEVSRCIGSDSNLRAKAEALQQRQRQLVAELEPLNAQTLEVSRTLSTLDAERRALEQSVESFRKSEAELLKKKAQIEKRAKAKSLTPAEVQKLNAAIAAHNTNVTASNAKRTQLVAMESALKEKADAYNRMVLQVNDQVSTFRAKNEAFAQDATHFDQAFSRYKAACAGHREIKK